MTIEHDDKIDALGLEKHTGKVVLSISDHLDWSDISTHLQALERKVNAYLTFIENDQIAEQIADAAGRNLKIAIYNKFFPPPEVMPILDGLTHQLRSRGIELWYGELPSSY